MTSNTTPEALERLRAFLAGRMYRDPSGFYADLSTLIAEHEAMRKALGWFANQTNLELSWGDHPDAAEGDPCAWLIYRVSGCPNDREWEFIASADTVIEAIEAARHALGAPDHA